MATYKLILARNNQEIEFIKKFNKRDSAIKEFNRLLENNKTVVFPRKYVNTKTIKEANYKIVVLKKREKNDIQFKLKNDYGEYVDHETTDEKWIIFAIDKYDIEEDFWVYGYDPLTDRKTFMFIWNNIIKPLTKNRYDFLNIFIYKNKLVISSNDNNNMIICKNKVDSIRFYNLLEEYSIKEKIKTIMFSGDWSTNHKTSHKAIQKIKSFTNWNERKITRPTTRP